MELIANTISSGVAVTDSLTTIIDWTCIESFADFTLIINNNGGGSADDITDIQIDTSTDGGVTVSLDQHPGVPAVPIADDGMIEGTFTESANFIRVRCICASGDDTTVVGYLLADTVTGRLCTLADVKARLGITATDDDLAINRIIASVESIFNSYTNRTLIRSSSAVTEYFTGGGPYIQLPRCPIEAVTSVKESADYDFDNTESLVANTDYRIIAAGGSGLLYRSCNWSRTPDSAQVVYTGGFVPAGSAAGSGQTALPNDIREAAIEQACFIFKRRDDLGLSAVSFNGESISKFSEMKLLPIVELTLNKYKLLTV